MCIELIMSGVWRGEETYMVMPGMCHLKLFNAQVLRKAAEGPSNTTILRGYEYTTIMH